MEKEIQEGSLVLYSKKPDREFIVENIYIEDSIEDTSYFIRDIYNNEIFESRKEELSLIFGGESNAELGNE